MRRPDLPRVVLRSVASTEGFDDGELARMVRRRELVPLQRGAYLERQPDTVEARHRAVVAATVAGLRREAVVSHSSAAALHDLPLFRLPLGRVHLIRRPPASGSGSARVRLHVARLGPEETTSLDGVVLTDVTRTVVDLARSVPFESAVVAADAALARGATTPDRLAGCLAGMGGVPGRRAAARVLAMADGRSESVGESRSRVLFQRLALPVPELQFPVRRRDGSIIGRCDFGWEGQRTLGEFDGRVTYGRLLRPGQSAGDAVYQEKLREDELRDHAWQVARWTWPELDTPAVIRDRLLRAFARGRGR
ncbi:MAG: Transcriptional regulator, AbiEi antitoxin, Type system [Modestobacter sp.]|nr:Transcriptional regulator, AbiEi antitoxin, Type system [Modestobacter sp.]